MMRMITSSWRRTAARVDRWLDGPPWPNGWWIIPLFIASVVFWTVFAEWIMQ